MVEVSSADDQISVNEDYQQRKASQLWALLEMVGQRVIDQGDSAAEFSVVTYEPWDGESFTSREVKAIQIVSSLCERYNMALFRIEPYIDSDRKLKAYGPSVAVQAGIADKLCRRPLF